MKWDDVDLRKEIEEVIMAQDDYSLQTLEFHSDEELIKEIEVIIYAAAGSAPGLEDLLELFKAEVRGKK